MKAIILAAGQGKRLRPLTDNLPKCMINFCGKTLLERQIDIMRKLDINEIIVVTGYKQEKINFTGIKKIINTDFNSTNMVESLFAAKEFLDDDVIVSYGDIIYTKQILEKILLSKEDFSVVVDLKWKDMWQKRFENPLDDAESLKMNNEKYILDLGRKINSLEEVQGQYIGLMKFSLKGTEFIKKFYEQAKKQAENGKNPLNEELSFKNSYMTDFIRSLIHAKCKIKAITIEGNWLEIDSVSDYNLYLRLEKEGILGDLV